MARRTQTLSTRLKLVRDDQRSAAWTIQRDPFKIDRRSEAREPAEHTVLASYHADGRFGITTLRLVDRSNGGVGATCDIAIEPGMRVTLAGEKATSAWIPGTVVRCTREGDEFRIGVRLSTRPAAA